MPEWLFALIVLVVICLVGVYVNKGFDGFVSYGQTPSSTVSSHGISCNATYSSCVERCNRNELCKSQCRTAFNNCSLGNIANDRINSVGDTTFSSLNTWFNNYAYGSLTRTPSSIPVNRNSPYLHSPTNDQLLSAQGGSGTTPFSSGTDSSPSTYTSLWNRPSGLSAPPSNATSHPRDSYPRREMHPSDYASPSEYTYGAAPTCAPALRDLIRSDMDEAVGSLVEKEVLQLKNQYEL
jgi:hypothetical protein